MQPRGDGLRALGSLVLGALAIFCAVLVVRQGLLPLIDKLFHPGEAWLSAFRRIGILLAAVTAYWAYVHWWEKREATELRLRPRLLALGGVAGAVQVGVPIALLFALGTYELVHFRGFSPGLFGVAGVIAIAAVLEELFYRCLLFRVLERSWGTVASLAVQALVFALEHLSNVERGDLSDALTMMVSVSLLGLLWAGLFVLTRNLWAVAAHHAAWNFTIMLSGLPLSGIEDWRALAPMDARYAGPDWMTGGLFGPENSIVQIVLIAIVVVLVLHIGWRRGAFIRKGSLG
ncbi:MAG TPA: type II CAAX endopeptidase family protein [Stenotrophomonas sp.]|nr:type II CAAX endopeptidase family protein [Stenotrophomonas sp.]